MATELYKGKIPIIRRSLDEGFLRGAPGPVSTGCVPRDFDIDPLVMRDSPDTLKPRPRSAWREAYDEQERSKSSLLHVYLGENLDTPAFKFLDQNGFPDCWFHSTAHAMMISRILQRLPVLRFNAVAGATLLNQLNGGWCGLSLKFARDNGLPVIGTGPGEWPYQSRRGNDTPELRASMAKHKDTSDVYDLGKREWDQELSDLQIAECTFNNWPTPSDYNAVGHSMLTLGYVPIGGDEWGRATLNSWIEFGYFGVCIIPETLWSVSNAVALRCSTASIN